MGSLRQRPPIAFFVRTISQSSISASVWPPVSGHCLRAVTPQRSRPVFALQHERVVARDNTVSFANRPWQLERCKLRATLAGCRVTIHEHLDETVSITFGPHLVGRFNHQAVPLAANQKTKAVELPPLR